MLNFKLAAAACRTAGVRRSVPMVFKSLTFVAVPILFCAKRYDPVWLPHGTVDLEPEAKDKVTILAHTDLYPGFFIS